MGYETLSSNSQNIKKFQLQQKARSFIVVLVIGVPVFLGMLAFLYYQDATKQNKVFTNPIQNNEAIYLGDENSITSDPNQISPGQPVDGGATPNYSNPANPNATNNSPAPGQSVSQPTMGGIPADLTSALNSIESNGIKGSPYVSSDLDTSNIPSGTSIQFDRGSWSPQSDSIGSINASISILGTSKSGSVTFSNTGGSWKATGYTLN